MKFEKLLGEKFNTVELSKPSEVTQLLIRYTEGDPAVLEELFRQIYSELRRLASYYVSKEKNQGTLQATALVHEAYFRLIDQTQVKWKNRAHFVAVAAQQMRRVLLDYSRMRNANKRGAGGVIVSFEEAFHGADVSNQIDIESLDKALDELAALSPRQAQVVELRYFGGLSIEETAEALGTSPATVKRDWLVAKAWLYDALQ